MRTRGSKIPKTLRTSNVHGPVAAYTRIIPASHYGSVHLPRFNHAWCTYLLCLEEYVGVRHELGPLPLLSLRLAAELEPVADDALAQLGQVGVAGEHTVLGLP